MSWLAWLVVMQHWDVSVRLFMFIGHFIFCVIVAWEWHMFGSCHHLLLIPNFLPRLWDQWAERSQPAGCSDCSGRPVARNVYIYLLSCQKINWCFASFLWLISQTTKAEVRRVIEHVFLFVRRLRRLTCFLIHPGFLKKGTTCLVIQHVLLY